MRFSFVKAMIVFAIVFVIGLLLVAAAFILAATVGEARANVVTFALSETLFTAGLGTVFAAFFLVLLQKVSSRVKAVLGCLGLVGFLCGFSVIIEQQDIPVIFSPALLAYPALGLTIMSLLTQFLPESSKRSGI